MTSSIPDGFSLDQLKSMHEEAIPEAVAHAVELSKDCDHPEGESCPNCSTDGLTYGPNDLTVDQVCDMAQAGLEEINEAVGHPIGHKVAAVVITPNMLSWHTRMAKKLIEDGEHGAATSWARDAGKFQAIINILHEIEVCNDDFTCPHE